MNDRWIAELGRRLWFLPGAEETARRVLAGEMTASQAAIRWREDLPRAFAEDLVDEELVHLLIVEMIQPVLVRLPRVFNPEEADEVFHRLLDASVQDVADRFCDVNEAAVERVAAGLAGLARGDDAGEGEIAEALASVVADRAGLVRGLTRTPELDEIAGELIERASVLLHRSPQIGEA